MNVYPKFKLSPPPKPNITEKLVIRDCLDVLNTRGYKAWRIHVMRVRTVDGRWLQLGDRGDPDYVVIHARYPGFLMEVKRPGGPLRPGQAFRHQQLRVGWRLAVAVVDSVDALATFLKEHERRLPEHNP